MADYWRVLPLDLIDRLDSRRFAKNRLRCLSGYGCAPSVDDSMLFFMNQSNPYTGRVVSYEEDDLDEEEDKLYLELYSRNSSQHPFFPGKPESVVPLAPIPRVDGNLGQFDATRNPQYYDARRPYLPFIKRAEMGTYSKKEPENAPAIDVWYVNTSSHIGQGVVQKDYWLALSARADVLSVEANLLEMSSNCASWPGFVDSKPAYPSESSWSLHSAKGPGSYMDFEECLAQLLPVQRWVKEFAAWVKMGKLLLSSPLRRTNTLGSTPLQPCDDSLIGLWINGLEEDKVEWFGRIGSVPLFIVHRIRGRLDNPTANSPYRKPSCIQYTTLNSNPLLIRWEGLFQASEARLISEFYDLGMARQENIPYDSYDRSPPQKSTIVNQTLATEILSSDHYTWIRPPAVKTAPSIGKWETFIEDSDADFQPCMRRVGKNSRTDSEDHDYKYFDRIYKRILFFPTKPIIPQGIAHNTGIFRIPCPELPFYTTNDFTWLTSPSKWIYESELPKNSDIGRVAPEPEIHRLPFLADKSPSVPSSELPSPSLNPTNFEQALTDSSDESTPYSRELTVEPMPVDVDSRVEINKPEVNRSEPTTDIDPEPISPNSHTEWLEKLQNPSTPPHAPTCLLRFYNISEVSQISLADFQVFTRDALQQVKSPKPIRLARIIRVEREGTIQYWAKAFDEIEAGWIIRAFANTITSDGVALTVGLLSRQEWLEAALVTKPEDSWTMEMVKPEDHVPSLRLRLNLPLVDRLFDDEDPTEEGEIQESEQVESSSSDPPAKKHKRTKTRGGKKKAMRKLNLGAIPSVDPQDLLNWNLESWLANVTAN
ncbi:hypothetical protein K435DRAFT_860496 [Dendrothele bispora CBS 962.96]|uniref:Uncharacterized protein n=1 Tax=Dendrothele bispora (strain CBS 962.96) TaxID=1314807 RepID=A0A4S8LXQ9_DENBC|nr:hypothetical protein K435DRAFT_860496 [Dendrothele bispora CBS 962.96]